MQKASGCLFGLALGDALAAPTEFLSVPEILRRFPPAGPQRPAGSPCLLTGEGWVAEEALATGLLCYLLFPDDPLAAIRRPAVSSGDSDSIACLAGCFAGAALGLAAWPEEWLDQIEYRERLARLGEAWD